MHLLADALEDALCPPHDARSREALGKEGDKGLGGEAASIIGPVHAALCCVTGEAAEAASGGWRHAADGRLVHEEVDPRLSILDGVAVSPSCAGTNPEPVEWLNASSDGTLRMRLRTFPGRSRRAGGGPDPAAVSSDTVQASPISRLIALIHSRYSVS